VLGPIDVHCHLLDDSFDSDRQAVIERAMDVGVCAVIEGSQNLSECRRALELASSHEEFIYVAAGLHPAYASRAEMTEIFEFIRANSEGLVALGEVGLDFYVARDVDTRSTMTDVFKAQIYLAIGLRKPMIVHSRSAGEIAIELLLDKGATGVVMHAFDGRSSFAVEAAKKGYFFSIPPSVVRSQQKRKLVKSLPAGCLLLETDSPVLGPTPDERNEPRNVLISAGEISRIKGIPVEKVIEITTRSAEHLFHIEKVC
jgi:TatD DNase family protein